METLLASSAALCGVTLIVGWLLHRAYKWKNPIHWRLPPGSMGLPIVGETLEFFKTSPSLDIPDYHKLRLKRYGPVFKTSLLGHPTIVSVDPEVNRFIFQQEGKLFESWLPNTANTILGKKSINEFNNSVQKFMRGNISRILGIESLKHLLLPEIEKALRDGFTTLAAGKHNFEVHDAIADMLIGFIAKKLICLDLSKSIELRKNYSAFLEGLISFPIYFPGTKFYKCMQGRKNMQKTLSELLRQRLSTPEKKCGDLLDIVIEELQSENPMIDEEFTVDAFVALLFAAFVTISPTLTLAFKFLAANPKAFEALKEEHEAILKKREDVDSGFTWAELKLLTFTTMVTNELNRMSNIAPGVFRKALTDVEVNGYTIPSGWTVMMNTMAVHLNPELFEDPLTFNPWRWMNAHQKNFLPFGHGVRACPAADFSKVFIAVFLHVLVTGYRWEEIKGGDAARKVVLMFPEGYQIRLVPATRTT